MSAIVSIPHPALTRPALAVTAFDRKLFNLLTDMKQTLNSARNPRGVGLAAPQIGVSLQIFLIKPTDKAKIRVFINPEITALENTDEKPQDDSKLEGCLSVPKVWGYVRRAKKLTLAYRDENGEKKTEEFTGFPAVIIQHEIDHLQGVLFTRRVVEQDGKLYEPKKDAKGKEYLEEMVI